MTAIEFMFSINNVYWREDVVLAKEIYLSCVLLNGMSVNDYLKAKVVGDIVELVIPMRTEKHCVRVTKLVNTQHVGDKSINPVLISHQWQRMFPDDFTNPRKVWVELAKNVCDDVNLIEACLGHKTECLYSQEEKDALTEKVANLVMLH